MLEQVWLGHGSRVTHARVSSVVSMLQRHPAGQGGPSLSWQFCAKLPFGWQWRLAEQVQSTFWPQLFHRISPHRPPQMTCLGLGLQLCFRFLCAEGGLVA